MKVSSPSAIDEIDHAVRLQTSKLWGYWEGSNWRVQFPCFGQMAMALPRGPRGPIRQSHGRAGQFFWFSKVISGFEVAKLVHAII
jgi:hypothetical protein